MQMSRPAGNSSMQSPAERIDRRNLTLNVLCSGVFPIAQTPTERNPQIQRGNSTNENIELSVSLGLTLVASAFTKTAERVTTPPQGRSRGCQAGALDALRSNSCSGNAALLSRCYI